MAYLEEPGSRQRALSVQSSPLFKALLRVLFPACIPKHANPASEHAAHKTGFRAPLSL